MQDQLERLVGSVERVTFHNEQNGFTVLELRGPGETVTVVGVMPKVAPGEELELMGRYDFHDTYGPQFKAELCERATPSTAAAILRYLTSGAIKGIGPATARRLVDRFGADTLRVLEKEPERLREIKGISADKARRLSEEYGRQFGVREVMLFFSRFGLTPDQSLAVFKRYGAAAADKVKADPYLLCGEGIRLPFEAADSIARAMGFGEDDPCRVEAGAEYVLRHNLGNGHTCIPREKLLPVAAGLLGCDTDAVDMACDRLVTARRLVQKEMGGKPYLFLPQWFEAEHYCAQRLAMMLRFPPERETAAEEDIDRIEAEWGITYAARQRQAIRAAVEKGLLILTGGPGTGKTTTLKAIIRLLEDRKLEIALAAPTGRAAKRMTELTGREAKTIHRLLEVSWGEDDRQSFQRGENNPLDCDALIVDELSMVDAGLFESLLRALRLGCRLILVGDSDQLPSVGAGNVLHDLLEAGALPAVRLTEVFRQAMESLIVTNAHAIVQGKYPVLDCKNGDFFLLKQSNPFLAARTVADLCARRLPEAYGFDPLSDIQVLCPSRKMDMGAVALNNALQARLNPPDSKRPEISRKGFTLRQGDRVMQVKNNYDIVWTKENGEGGAGVFNGDVGILDSLDPLTGTLTVRFDDRLALYAGEEIEQLELAYAMTIHKSQGSEFPCVILPLLDIPPKLQYRNLLYTAVTRARQLLIIVGSPRVACAMVDNDRRTRRYTALRPMLEAAVKLDGLLEPEAVSTQEGCEGLRPVRRKNEPG